MCLCTCRFVFAFVCLCAPRLCGSVTDRMRPLSGRCWGDNQYCSPRCVNPTLSCVFFFFFVCVCVVRDASWGRARGVWTRIRRGPPDTGLCCLFYDTWQDNESIAPLKISPMGALSLCISSMGECYYILFLGYTVNSYTRCPFKGTSILLQIQNQERLFVDMMYLLTWGGMNRNLYLQHTMTLDKIPLCEQLSTNNQNPEGAARF